jgi:hypothetical protein
VLQFICTLTRVNAKIQIHGEIRYFPHTFRPRRSQNQTPFLSTRRPIHIIMCTCRAPAGFTGQLLNFHHQSTNQAAHIWRFARRELRFSVPSVAASTIKDSSSQFFRCPIQGCAVTAVSRKPKPTQMLSVPGQKNLKVSMWIDDNFAPRIPDAISIVANNLSKNIRIEFQALSKAMSVNTKPSVKALSHCARIDASTRITMNVLDSAASTCVDVRSEKAP